MWSSECFFCRYKKQTCQVGLLSLLHHRSTQSGWSSSFLHCSVFVTLVLKGLEHSCGFYISELIFCCLNDQSFGSCCLSSINPQTQKSVCAALCWTLRGTESAQRLQVHTCDSAQWKQTVDTQMSSKVRKETRGGGRRGGRLPGMSFLRAIAAALWDSYSTKAKPRFLFLSVVLGYTIASTTPSVTWTHRRRGGGAETEIWETHTASEKRANSTTGRVKGIIWF